MGSRRDRGKGWELIRPDGPAEEGPTPAPGPLRIRLEKRRKGKVVTVISGHGFEGESLKDLARELKRACGTGGGVEDGALVLQGDHREAVRDRLRERGIG